MLDRMLCRLQSIVHGCLVSVVLTGSAAMAFGQQRAVDLELILAVDVSASVSPAEFDLQRRGLAEAFRDPAVHSAIEAGNEVAVALLYWSGDQEQSMVVDWSLVSDAASSAEFADKIETTERGFGGQTAIGEAMLFAAHATVANAYQGERIVIDISGDGWTNVGRTSSDVRDELAATGITINGLAILNEGTDVVTYYRDNVVGGPGAFVESASDYRDFTRAFRRKLVREILWRPSI